MHSGRKQKQKVEAGKRGSKRVQKEMYGKLMFIALLTNIHFGTPLCLAVIIWWCDGTRIYLCVSLSMHPSAAIYAGCKFT